MILATCLLDKFCFLTKCDGRLWWDFNGNFLQALHIFNFINNWKKNGKTLVMESNYILLVNIWCRMWQMLSVFYWDSNMQSGALLLADYFTSYLPPHRCWSVNSYVLLCHAINVSQSECAWTILRYTFF